MGIGIQDLKNVLRLPTTWDLDYLTKWRTVDGITFDRLVQEIGSAIVLFNRSLTEGYWAQYVRPTTDLTTEYTVGQSGTLQKISEYSRPDPTNGDTTGHMLPLDDYGGALGWTYLAMRRMRGTRYETDTQALITKARNTYEVGLLTRMFKMEADTVGATGKSVPFADGGTADSAYIPPAFGGKTFANTHTHYIRQTADATGRGAYLSAAADHLVEHGLTAPFDLVIPEVDIANWATTGLGFKRPQRLSIVTAGVETRAAIDEAEYLGMIEIDRAWFRVKTSPRLPTNYAGAFKVFGANDALSPLALRYEEGYPLGLTLVGEVRDFPLQEAVAYLTFGFGVNNRLAGVPGYFAASGSYITPTIS